MEQEVIHGFKVHPAASMLPNLGKRDFKELAQDIKTRGLEEPIILTPDGQLVDGRQRLRAYKEAFGNVKDIPTRVLDVDKDDPAAIVHAVYSLGIQRRHLNKTQRIALRTKLLHEIGAKESDEETAKETDSSPETVKKVKKLLKNGSSKKVAKALANDTSGRGRPKGGGPPRVVALNREEMGPKELAALLIKKWNDVPRSFLARFVEQLNTQWEAFEKTAAPAVDADEDETEDDSLE